VSARVLIIEDDHRLAALVCEYLEDKGFLLRHSDNAADGLLLVRRESFDALLLDVMLPDGDGFDLCREIRAESNLPIIMLTARGEETDRIIGLELGADDYLPKPFNPRELLARLRAVLRRHGGSEPTDGGTLGDLVLDVDARRISIGEREVEVTSYQFEILRILTENAGRVVSRERLMEELRGDRLAAFDRSIDVHISRLRSAIEEDPKRPRRIQTVRGVGYRFVSVVPGGEAA